MMTNLRPKTQIIYFIVHVFCLPLSTQQTGSVCTVAFSTLNPSHVVTCVQFIKPFARSRPPHGRRRLILPLRLVSRSSLFGSGPFQGVGEVGCDGAARTTASCARRLELLAWADRVEPREERGVLFRDLIVLLFAVYAARRHRSHLEMRGHAGGGILLDIALWARRAHHHPRQLPRQHLVLALNLGDARRVECVVSGRDLLCLRWEKRRSVSGARPLR